MLCADGAVKVPVNLTPAAVHRRSHDTAYDALISGNAALPQGPVGGVAEVTWPAGPPAHARLGPFDAFTVRGPRRLDCVVR